MKPTKFVIIYKSIKGEVGRSDNFPSEYTLAQAQRICQLGGSSFTYRPA